MVALFAAFTEHELKVLHTALITAALNDEIEQDDANALLNQIVAEEQARGVK